MVAVLLMVVPGRTAEWAHQNEKGTFLKKTRAGSGPGFYGATLINSSPVGFTLCVLTLDVKCRRLIFSLIIFMLILDGKFRRLIFDDQRLNIGQRLQRYRRLWWLWWR